MSRRYKIIQLLSTLTLFIVGVAMGFGIGFEYGTGVPITSLFGPNKSVTTPANITVRTTSDAQAIIEEALQDKSYGPGYNCLDYAWDAMRALNWDGQPAAIAAVMYDNRKGHAAVLTATEDRGWVFLDPGTSMIIKPTVGGRLMEHTITDIKIMTIHWVQIDDFLKNPKFEEYDK